MVINSMSNEKRVKLRKPERQKYMILINLRKEEKGKGCNVIDFPFSELCATELYFYAGLKCPKKCICALAIFPECGR